MEFIKRILQHENIDFKEITKSSSGFTNYVYFVDDKYVVKMINNQEKQYKLLNEIKIYKNVDMEEMSKYITSGTLEGRAYLIIEKIPGKSLFKIWHLLSDNERREIVRQIAEILKKFHSQDYHFLSKEITIDSWQRAWQENFKLNIKYLEKYGCDTSKIKEFAKEKLDDIFQEQKYCLVYNDAHFDNFIYDKGKIKIIDFDRVKVYSKDYELLIIKQMLDNPIKFASEEDEKNVNNEDYQFVYGQLKEFYPELFNFSRLEERIFVYQFIYNLGQSFEYNDEKRMKNELDKFCTYFNL